MHWMIRIFKWQSYNCNMKEADTGTLHCGHATKWHIGHYMFVTVGWLNFNDKFFVSEFPFPNAFKGCVSLESLKCSLLWINVCFVLFSNVKSLLLPFFNRPHKVDRFVFARFSCVHESSGARDDSGFFCSASSHFLQRSPLRWVWSWGGRVPKCPRTPWCPTRCLTSTSSPRATRRGAPRPAGRCVAFSVAKKPERIFFLFTCPGSNKNIYIFPIIVSIDVLNLF